MLYDFDKINIEKLERTKKRGIEMMKSLKNENSLVEFLFFLKPIEIIGDTNNKIKYIKFEKTKLDENNNSIGTGEFLNIECDLLFRYILLI
jgi:NADPH-dependent glutamate synthase beta subunit-like oxidoreductase